MTKFISSPSPQYFAPATYARLTESGALENIEFDCQFKRMSKFEIDALDERIKAGRKAGDDVDAMVLKEICLGWRVSVKATEGVPASTKVIPFAPELLAEMENESLGFSAACMRSFYLSTSPAKSAHYAEKN